MHRDERGAHRHLGLAEADIAADQAVHRRRSAHVGNDLVNRAGLIRRLLERKGRLETVEIFGLDFERNPRPACPSCLHFEQLGRHVGDFLRCATPGSLPLPAAELVQRRGFRIDSGIAGDEVQRTHRYVELVTVRVVDPEKLSVRAADGENLETRVAPDSMRFVYHGCSDPELVQVPDHAFGVSSSPTATTALGGTRAEQLRFRNHRH